MKPKENNIPVIYGGVFLFVVLMLCYVLFIGLVLSEDLSGLLLNIGTEGISIIITVVVVERIIRIRDTRKWKPVKDIVYARLYRLVNSQLGTWKAYSKTLSFARDSQYIFFGEYRMFSYKLGEDSFDCDAIFGGASSYIKLLVRESSEKEVIEKFDSDLDNMVNSIGFFVDKYFQLLDPELLQKLTILELEINATALKHADKYLPSLHLFMNVPEIIRLVININKYLEVEKATKIQSI